MNRLPDPKQPTAPQAGQPTINPAATAFLKDLESAYENTPSLPRVPTATSFRDPTPTPTIGTAPPVTQPGRPPMSSKAVDDTARMIGASVVIAVTGGAATSVLWASGHADPEVIAWVCAAPVGLAVPILAFSSLVKRLKQAVETAPAEHHTHNHGPAYYDNRTYTNETQNRAVWVKNTNQLPR